jgi:putative CocE/NonD family hydrolase
MSSSMRSFARVRRAAVVGGAIGLALSCYFAYRAGSAHAYSAGEWALILVHLAAWPILASSCAFAVARSRAAGMFFILFTVSVLVLLVGAVRTYIDPVVVASQYVSMSDGHQLAVSVLLRRAPRAGERLPAILVQTRYHRLRHIRFPYSIVQGPYRLPTRLAVPFVRRGYAYVIVDVRGSGASTGLGGAQTFDQISRDGAELVAWIRRQPWSNGVIGAEGNSYTGTTAEMLLRNPDLSISAVIPAFAGYDFYEEVYWPGGVFHENFIHAYDQRIRGLDSNKPNAGPSWLEGVAPVDDDASGAQLRAALEQHEKSPSVADLYSKMPFKDDVVSGQSLPARSPYMYREAIVASGAALYSISGWYDGKYPSAAIKRFLNTPNPGSRLIIGPWDHGGRQSISPCEEERDVRFDPIAESLRFFDWHLKGIDTGISHAPKVQYYVMCGNKWRSGDSWPPQARQTSLYLASHGGLTLSAPTEATAVDVYRVDLQATTGPGARWQSYVNSVEQDPIGYPERNEQNRRLQTYTSQPLPEPLEIVGHPTVTLHLDANGLDGYVFVYLEDIDPRGRVRYITEGELRLIHRKLAGEPAPYISPVAHRTFARRDAAPLVPGERAEIAFDLIPIAFEVRRGHRLRLSIGAADRDNFGPPPQDAATLYRIHREAAAASRVVVPVLPAAAAAKSEPVSSL